MLPFHLGDIKAFRSELPAQISTRIGNFSKRATLQIGAKADMLALIPSFRGGGLSKYILA